MRRVIPCKIRIGCWFFSFSFFLCFSFFFCLQQPSLKEVSSVKSYLSVTSFNPNCQSLSLSIRTTQCWTLEFPFYCHVKFPKCCKVFFVFTWLFFHQRLWTCTFSFANVAFSQCLSHCFITWAYVNNTSTGFVWISWLVCSSQ